MFLVTIFMSYIYQPFLNILVFFYWLDGLATHGHPDMGIAVIFLTIVIRILLLPVSLAEDESEAERRVMIQKLHEIEAQYAGDPITLRQETRKLFHRNRKVVIAEMFSFFLQAIIALMLWKMFETGLPGQDIPLIYKFMPHIDLPFNLLFLGKYDLSHTNFTLNLMQSLMIFLVETASIMTSPYPPMKGEVVRLQLVLPVVSFLIFMLLPAGKKVFVITTLIISLILIIYKFIRRKLTAMFAPPPEEPVVTPEAVPAVAVPVVPLQPGVPQAGLAQPVQLGALPVSPTPQYLPPTHQQSPQHTQPATTQIYSSQAATQAQTQLKAQPQAQYQERILKEIR